MATVIEGGGELHEACPCSRRSVHHRPRGRPRRGADPPYLRPRGPVPGHHAADPVPVQAAGVPAPLVPRLPHQRRPRPQRPREALTLESRAESPQSPRPDALITRRCADAGRLRASGGCGWVRWGFGWDPLPGAGAASVGVAAVGFEVVVPGAEAGEVFDAGVVRLDVGAPVVDLEASAHLTTG